MSGNGKHEPIEFQVIPHDACPRRCEPVVLGMPVAFAGPPEQRVVRYICPRCRLIWDCKWDITAPTNGAPLGLWPDRYIRCGEGLEAHPTEDGIEYPAGPATYFEEQRR